MLNSVSIWIENGVTKVYATNYFSLSPSSLQTYWNIPIDFPLGIYPIKLTFGAVTQGASPGTLQVLESSASLVYNFTTADFTARARAGYSLSQPSPTGVVSNDIFRISKRSTAYSVIDDSLDNAIKTKNIFSGAINSSWEIILEITSINYTTAGSNIFPGIVLTETTDAEFISAESIVLNKIIARSISRQTFISTDGGVIYQPTVIGYVGSIVIRKSGNKVAVYGFNPSTGEIRGYAEYIIDTSKLYALALLENTTISTNFQKEIQISATIYNA